eukprot:scaffold126849_cov51-Phaeocystis_antarctica.AAC.1
MLLPPCSLYPTLTKSAWLFGPCYIAALCRSNRPARQMRYHLGAQIPYDETDAAPHLGALLGRRGGYWKEAVQQGVQEEVPEVPEDLQRAAVTLALAAAALAAAALAAAALAAAAERLQRPYKHGE